MEKIGLHNYEAFLLDYLEGNLAEPQITELKLFALTHPELEIDLDMGALPVFSHEDIPLDFKEQLKKTEADLQSEMLLNYLEGNLSEEVRTLMESKLLNDKNLALELELLKKTILQADRSVLFPEKNKLHKTEEDLVLSNRVIAYYEQLMPASEKQAFEQELSQSFDLRQELELVSKTRLRPDASLTFPDKNELKKSGRVIALFTTRSDSYRTVVAIAASILLLLTLSLVITYYTKQQPAPALAETKRSGVPATEEASPKLQPAPAKTKETPTPQPAQHGFAISSPSSTDPKMKQEPVPAPQSPLPLNQVAEHKESVAPQELPEKKDDAISTPALLTEVKKADNQGVINIQTSAPDSAFGQTHALAVLEEGDDDEADAPGARPKGFWQKAVRVAKKINSLGIKNIDGAEQGNKNYSLSFNSFSVEKH
jgi:hypothetical protein